MPLKISHLSKKYDDRWILRDVNFEAANGEITGIFGSSGAGKSTLIRLIAGTEKCTSGTLHHDAEEVTALSCDQRKFHFPRLTNESFWQTIFKTDKKSQLADGEGQVLALEESIKKADSVLLLDDSFCYMDLLLRTENYDKLRVAVRDQNLIVIIATNDYDEAMMLCDKVAVLSSGEIKQAGTPREVYESPNSAQVAGICGRNNVFTARRLTSSKSETPEFQTLDGEHQLFTRKTETRGQLGALHQNVNLMIRPEHISISFGASFPEDNLLKAKIADIKFFGATTLIRLDSNGLKLEALVLRLVGLNIGDECMVGLPPDRILVLKD